MSADHKVQPQDGGRASDRCWAAPRPRGQPLPSPAACPQVRMPAPRHSRAILSEPVTSSHRHSSPSQEMTPLLQVIHSCQRPGSCPRPSHLRRSQFCHFSSATPLQATTASTTASWGHLAATHEIRSQNDPVLHRAQLTEPLLSLARAPAVLGIRTEILPRA